MDPDHVAWQVAERLVRLGRAARRRLRRKSSLAEAWAALDPNAPGDQIDVLRVALRGGAYDLAARLAHALRDRKDAAVLVEEALRAVGQGGPGAAPPPVEELAALARRRPLLLLSRPELHLALATIAWEGDPAGALAALNRFLRSQGLPRCTRPRTSGNLLADLSFAAPRPLEAGPRVSVLLAARDAAATIGYAVDSILSQSWRNLELLACDDGSQDETLDVLRARRRRDPRLRVFASRANQGAYNVRNALLARARGVFVTYHDADDLALPGRVAAQVERLRQGAIATYLTMLRTTRAGRFSFFEGGSPERLAMVSLMARREHIGVFRSARFGADLEMREALRARHGERAFDVLRQVNLLVLSSEASLTRREGSESLEDGYRSPARRAYSELVFRRYVVGDASDADVEAALRSSDNWVEPAEISELDA